MFKSILLVIILFSFVTIYGQKDFIITKEECDIRVKQKENSFSKIINFIFMPDSIIVVGDKKEGDKEKKEAKAVELLSIRVGEKNYHIIPPNEKNVITIPLDFSSTCSNCGDAAIIKFKNCDKEIRISINDYPGKTVCNGRSAIDNFGENYDDYKNGKETIILDFNRNINQRTYYRVYKKCGQNQLTTEPVNFSRYKVWGNKDIEFKVVNVNRFIYDVEFSDSTTIFKSEPSPLFNEFFKGENSGTLGDLIAAFKKDMKDEIKNNIKTKDSLNLFQTEDSLVLIEFIDLLEQFGKEYNKLQGMVLDAYNPSKCFPASGNFQYETYANQLLHINVELAKMQADWQPKADTLEEMKGEQKKCEETDKQKKELEKSIKELEAVEKPSDAQKASLKELKEKLAKLKVCSEADKKKVTEVIERLEKELKPYNALIELEKELPKENDMQEMIVFINNIIDMNQTYSSGPIQVKGNELKITLDIHTNDSIVKYYHIPKLALGKRNYIIPIVGRGFGSFGSGVFISPDPRLKNKEYAWQELPNSDNVFSGGDSARYILTEKGFSPPPMGFAAYGNIQMMFTRNLGIGISPGVGITMEAKPRVTYLLGGSLFAGSDRQFVFTGGVSAMQVKKLSNNLNYIVENNVKSISNTQEITYYQEMKFGFYLSLSYTIFTPLSNKN